MRLGYLAKRPSKKGLKRVIISIIKLFNHQMKDHYGARRKSSLASATPKCL